MRSVHRVGVCVASCLVFCAGVGVAQTVTGTFFPAQAHLSFGAYAPSQDIATGDLNDDGIPDVVGANALFTAGVNSMPFRGLLHNEDATSYSWFSAGLSTIPTYWNGFRRSAIADFDEDGKLDVITLTFPFELVLSRNQGQGGSVQGYANHTLVAPSFAALLGLTFPNTLADPLAHTPIFMARDFDHDGHADLLLGVSLMHGMFGVGGPDITNAGLVFFWGNGNGTFAAPQHVPLPGDVPLDAEWVDWDGNGSSDTLLYLSQSVVVAPLSVQYQGQLTLFDINVGPQGTRSLVPRGQTQGLGPYTYTSFVYLPGTAGTPRILALAGHEIPSPTQMRAAFFVTEIDSSGAVQMAPAVISPTMASPGNTDLQGIQAADFDRDGHLDLVALVDIEGNLMAPLVPSEIAFVAGPFDAFGAHGAKGSLAVANSGSPAINQPPIIGSSYVFRPNRGYPEVVNVVDLDSDRVPDLVVSNAYRVAPGATTLQRVLMAVHNLTPAAPGTQVGGIQRTGLGTPNPSGRLARCGVQGGAPVYGSTSFQISLRDAPMSGFAAVVGSYWPNPNVTLGLSLAMIPDWSGGLQVLSASQEGAGRLDQPLYMPANPALLGSTSASFQWLIFDANTGTLECSDAIHVSYGF